MKRRRLKGAASALLIVALGASLVACSNDPLADQYRAGDNKGYIAGDFRVVEIPAEKRTEPVDFAGTTEAGDAVESDSYRGDALVVNFWYAACGPCRKEAPVLEDAFEQVQDSGADFLGINTVDSAATAAAFAENYGVGYPSVIASEDPSIKLAFAAQTPINATPTTLVLDKEGRVAARIIGELSDVSILTTLVADVQAES